MPTYKDQMNRSVIIPRTPTRIISLVPSQTELLHYYGLEEEVVGITKFCIHPNEWFQSKARVGGTKNIDIEKVKALKPDLIIGNKEENTIEDITELEKIAPVWMSDVNTFEEALEMNLEIGKITANELKAQQLNENILAEKEKCYLQDSKSAIYLIWNNPFMCAGKETFIDSMMSTIGLNNMISESRYPEITIAVIQKLAPKLLLLSTEPFPFDLNHLKSIQTKLPNTKVEIVDGEMFSWYGSRLLKSFAYFKETFKN
jgi:ABC-type Fe3+-hydroxamate transport system substrate-binding protein